MQDLINKFETLLTRVKVEKCKQVKITSYFGKEKQIFTVILLYSLCLLVHLLRLTQVSQRLSHDILVFFRPIQPLVNASSKYRYLEFSPSVISPSRSHAISKVALSRIFCPVPSEFEIVGLDFSSICFSVEHRRSRQMVEVNEMFVFGILFICYV